MLDEPSKVATALLTRWPRNDKRWVVERTKPMSRRCAPAPRWSRSDHILSLRGLHAPGGAPRTNERGDRLL